MSHVRKASLSYFQIYKRQGIWYVDLRINGRRFRKKAGKSKHLAELALKGLEVKAERNQLGFLEQKNIRIKAFLDEFVKYSETNHRSATTVRYRSVIKNLNQFLALTPSINTLRDFTPEILEKYKQYRKTATITKNGKPLDKVKGTSQQKGAKSYTVNFELGTLRTIFNLAIKQRYLETNPIKEVGFLKVTDSKQRRFLTETECERLLVTCEPEWHPIFFTLLYTGMRKGELVNLEWTDLDFSRQIIKIQRKPFWIPKTGEREIPMSSEVVAALNKLPRRSNFVFTDKNGEPYEMNRLRLELIRIAKKAGIQALTQVHALRHTFASRLLMRGVDLPSVQKLMGHTKIETTMIYSHQTPDHLRSAIEKLSKDSAHLKSSAS